MDYAYKGLTYTTKPCIGTSYFNPRTHTACDAAATAKPGPTIGFNPRTHTACDDKRGDKRKRVRCFNPRTHTACDRDSEGTIIVAGVSIHARTRRATPQGYI